MCGWAGGCGDILPYFLFTCLLFLFCGVCAVLNNLQFTFSILLDYVALAEFCAKVR